MSELRKKKKGIKLSDEHRKNVSEGLKKAYREGRKKPPMLGKKHSKEALKKISEASKDNTNTKGRKLSKEHKNKLRKVQLGRNKGISYEELYGKEKADEMKRKLSLAHKNQKPSEEHRKKISEYWKGRTRKRKSWEGYLLLTGHFQ